jgi:aspartyl protease family protein
MLMVDTGASFVTLTPADAKKVGIDPDRLSYSVPIRTANGLIQAAPVKLKTLSVGSITRHDVSALVSPGDALDQSLLGMTFLNTLDGYAISGDRMVLTP